MLLQRLPLTGTSTVMLPLSFSLCSNSSLANRVSKLVGTVSCAFPFVFSTDEPVPGVGVTAFSNRGTEVLRSLLRLQSNLNNFVKRRISDEETIIQIQTY